ncbi:MAG TPA: 5-amino-6-(D-ribitylamino)uracil--L-tyrosine 4-hydroxyphenyl transferase CofH [Solirubrobacteraceae bacterium]|nr:5-amino-6-(D-ribitylamino)uracil--L-tyrosine 4-hydroxyphenyl transferase CofH [Solirubrobacteraceae bacterium]
MRRRVTFSRNLTLSLSRTCRCYCKYCAFATHKAHLYAPEEVLKILDDAARRRVKELLVLTGEHPEVNPEVRTWLASYGHEDFTGYVVWTCERALERGLLPHTNLGVLSRDDLARLRDVTASQGLMLESVSERLMQTVHAGSPTKHPARRLETIHTAGELKIPFTSGILVGIGETLEERVASLEALAAAHAQYGHIQEVILQNFVPHQSYYGQEPAEIADAAARAYWRTGVEQEGAGAEHTFEGIDQLRTGSEGKRAGVEDDPVRARPQLPLPRWATEGAGAVSIEDMKLLIAETRRLMPDVGIQIPPNLADWWSELVAAGATDLGGLSANGDHISPEHPFPSPHQVRKRLQTEGFALTERLCVYPQYIDPEWVSQGVLDTIKLKFWSFIPRRGSGGPLTRTDPPTAIRSELVSGAIEKGRDGRPLDAAELTALFAETRPEAIEQIRIAADELRAELAGETVTFVVNRNINISNVCTVGCAFCGFGQGKRSPDAYQHEEPEFVRRVLEAIDYGASELCIQSGIHPDWDLEDYLGWLRLAKGTARDAGTDLHLHAYSPMEIAHMCDISGLPAAEVFARLRDAGLDSTPGTAAEVLHDGVRERISPNKLPVARWVEIIEASHAAGLRSTSTVMFGHIEEPWELAEHMRVVRELQERTGGITEFVPLSFIPFQTMLGRTHGVEEISREENLKHTAVFRLALGRTIGSLQASWVKMGLDAATESLRWGVNDLGGTLMEESISRLAGSYHGTKLDPEQLVAAAHRAGRPAAERTTLYGIRRHYPLLGADASSDTGDSGTGLRPASPSDATSPSESPIAASTQASLAFPSI